MKISIIIPVYNVEPYIEKCLASVVAQTFCGSIECILVDDCGSDNSVSLIETFIEKYTGTINFFLLHHDQNKGLSAARNTGIYAATGEYLYFLDSDDAITPDCLEKMAGLVKRYPDVELVQGGRVANETENSFSMKNFSYNEYIEEPFLIKINLFGNRILDITAWNKLVKKDFILRNKLYFKEGLIHEDIVWTMSLARVLNKIAVLKDDVYIYNNRPGSIMSSKESSGYALYLPAYKAVIEGIDAKYRNDQVLSISKRLMDLYYKAISLNDYSVKEKILDLYKLLIQKASFPLSLQLRFRLFLEFFYPKKGNLSYWLIYQLSCSRNFLDILKKILHKTMNVV